MTERDFRLEQSELLAEDEYTDVPGRDLPYFTSSRGSFRKLP